MLTLNNPLRSPRGVATSRYSMRDKSLTSFPLWAWRMDINRRRHCHTAYTLGKESTKNAIRKSLQRRVGRSVLPAKPYLTAISWLRNILFYSHEYMVLAQICHSENSGQKYKKPHMEVYSVDKGTRIFRNWKKKSYRAKPASEDVQAMPLKVGPRKHTKYPHETINNVTMYIHVDYRLRDSRNACAEILPVNHESK